MKFKLLVTDDDASLMALYHAIFDPMRKVQVDYASDATACREFLAVKNYDMVLLDIALSAESWDGLNLLDEIQLQTPSTSVIMMSTMDDDSMVERCLRHGCADFVSKNQNLVHALRAKVERLLFQRAFYAARPLSFGCQAV